MELSKLSEALADCRESVVFEMIEEKLATKTDPISIISECNDGMVALGERFESGEAFIPDLMFAGMIMKKVSTRLEPFLNASEVAKESKPVLVIGTVKNDVHDIGKDITAMVFRSNGFQVVDLGVDVAPEKFVDAVKEHKPKFLGMSLLLTTCYKSVMDTVEAVKVAGLRNEVLLCVGGAAASELMSERSGCDFYGKTAINTLRWAKMKCEM